MNKRMILYTVILTLGILLVLFAYGQYRNWAYVPNTSIQYIQLLDLLEENFEDINFYVKKGTYKKEDALPTYNQYVRCSALLKDWDIEFTITIIPVTGAPVPFSGAKGWGIETDLPVNYITRVYQAAATKNAIDRIEVQDIPDDKILLNGNSNEPVYYSQSTSLFYESEDMQTAKVLLIDEVDSEEFRRMVIKINEYWYISKK